MRLALLLFALLPTLGASAQILTVNYGPEDRQFLDIHFASVDCNSPVYFDAHFNGGTTALPADMVEEMTSNGITVISWESVPFLEDQADVELGWSDAELMFQWVHDNAGTYNLDTSQMIIGGSSRGTILSWKYAHAPNPNIKGLYMYNALPANIWTNPDVWYPADEVTEASPPVFFVYRREPGCSTDPDDPDIHDPDYASIIMDTYTDLGIGDRDTLIHSLVETDNTDRYQFLLEFALSVVEPCFLVDVEEAPTAVSPVTAYPNPFSDQLRLLHAPEGTRCLLRDATGKTVLDTTALQSESLSFLAPGMYVLTVFDGDRPQTVRVVKSTS